MCVALHTTVLALLSNVCCQAYRALEAQAEALHTASQTCSIGQSPFAATAHEQPMSRSQEDIRPIGRCPQAGTPANGSSAASKGEF